MSGRHEQGLRRSVGARWVAGSAALLVAAATVLLGSPVGAATTIRAQLSFTGTVTPENPTGGSVIGVHPGDSVNFTTAAVPTAGLDTLGLGDLAGGLLGGLASFRTVANFAGLPGGAANTVLAGSKAALFTFPRKGTYNFTYQIQELGLGGAQTINLDGNRLKRAGVKLNASNQYVGSIVVATNPPKGGISIQLPGIKVSPKVGGIQLPTISIPGVQLPTIHASVPNLNPGKPGSTGGSKAAVKAPPAKASDYTPPALTVPEMVVPKGSGDAVYAGNGGFANGIGGGNGGNGPQILAGGVNQAKAGSTGGDAPANGKVAKSKTVDLASRSSSPSSSVPIVLAILAVLALALVAGTYARLFLMRKP